MDNTSEKLSRFAGAMRTRPLSPSQRSSLMLRLLDTVGCGVAASVAAPVQSVCAAVLKLGGSGPCTVLAHGQAPVDRATLLNGFMTRYLDCNDSYLGKKTNCHPSDLMAPALAVGEAEHRSGDEVLRAIGAGYHVFLTLCDAAATYDRGWDHVCFGAVATAVEAGMLLHLSGEQMAHAISMAIVPQVALRQTRTGALSHWKGLAFGNAAAHAVLAAYLAAAGTTGPDAPFEGRYGLEALVCGPLAFQLDPARDRTNDSDFKLYPIGNGAQGPVELALELRLGLGNPARNDAAAVLRAVDSAEIRTYGAALVRFADSPDKWRPINHETADHSIPFLFALTLAYGYLDYDAIDRGIADPAVLELTSRVRTLEDPALTGRHPPAKPAHIKITGRDLVLEAHLEAPLGNVTRPLAPERIVQKFHEQVVPVLGSDRAVRLERRLLAWDDLADVAGALQV
jgi:2-methylcitrate dehydratase